MGSVSVLYRLGVSVWGQLAAQKLMGNRSRLKVFFHDARTQLTRPEAARRTCSGQVQQQFGESRDLNRASTGRDSRFVGADGGRH